jgi:RNA polymerase-binding transcription factor DksA
MNTDTFKTQLTEEKEKLEGELSTVGRRNPSNPADWEPTPSEEGSMEPDPNDQADQIEDYEGNSAILKDLEVRYNHVLAALARIDAGTYGACSVGGEEIEEARLNADPAAATCIAHVNG